MAYYFRPQDPASIPGAIVEVRTGPFGLISHRGMRSRPNPLTGEQRILHSPKNRYVTETSELAFSDGRAILPVAVPLTLQAQEMALQRMESLVGLPWNVFNANCQHTTNWAALGIPRSEQLEGLVGLGLLAAVRYGLSRN